MLSRKMLSGFVAIVAASALIVPTLARAVEEGDLIKMRCDAGAAATDTCRAVYYVGIDGQRHLFPNEDVFYSWYDNFNNVIEVNQDTMNDYPVGKNVTLKPGTSVIKFQSSDKVYAVAEGGILRHYLTPSLVAADYGDDWASNDLVTMPDTYFSDYRVGNVIDSYADYDPQKAEDSVRSIDDKF